MLKRTGWIAAAFCLSLAGIALAYAPQFAVVNGIKSNGSVIVQNGKAYVSVEALKQGGAQVTSTSSQVTISFRPMDGRDQVDAVEGKLEQWIQNESWRMRVVSVKADKNPFGRGPGFLAEIEFRNLAQRPISPYQSGMDKLQIIDSKGQVLSFGQATFKHFFRDVAPGGQIKELIQFGDQSNAATALGEPDKLMAFFRKTGATKAKDMRVFLKS